MKQDRLPPAHLTAKQRLAVSRQLLIASATQPVWGRISALALKVLLDTVQNKFFENVNWEIRKDVPKGSDISKYSKLFFQKLEKKLDDRFMECLDYQTPNEAILKHMKIKKLRELRRKKRK